MIYTKEQVATNLGMDYGTSRALDTVLYNFRKEMREGEHFLKLHSRQIVYTAAGYKLLKTLWKQSADRRNTYAPKNPHRGKRGASSSDEEES